MIYKSEFCVNGLLEVRVWADRERQRSTETVITQSLALISSRRQPNPHIASLHCSTTSGY
eukprot:scaffold1243_cov173-Ochromonas_danica.AAC.4